MTPPVEVTAECLAEIAEESGVPKHLVGGLVRYINGKVPTGSFLRCVLEGDAEGAGQRGDILSIAGLGATLRFLENHAPAECHGSAEKVEAWLKVKP